VGLCLALGLAVPYGIVWLLGKPWDQFRQAPLRSLSVRNAGTSFSDPFLIEKSGIQIGQNLQSLSAEEAKARLEAVPGIKKVRVEIRLPDTALIEVEERTPLAWISCPEHGIEPLREHGFFIDEESVVFPCGRMDDRLAILPSIEIRGVSRPVAGAKVDAEWVRESIKLVKGSEIFLGGLGMSLIDVRPLGDWGLLCHYPGNLMVTFSCGRLEGGLRDLFAIVSQARAMNLSLAAVNVAPARNMPVTFQKEVDPSVWQNNAETEGKNHVIRWDENREKHLRAIFGSPP